MTTKRGTRALDRRCAILRHLAAQGGTQAGVKMPDFAVAIGMDQEVLKDDLHALRDLGAIEITRRSMSGVGGLPNEYRQLLSESAFREQSDALVRALSNRRAAATRALRDLEEQRVRDRMAKREQRSQRQRQRAQRRKKGLPAEPPPVGEPEPKTTQVSDALLKARVAEGLELDVDELARWGA